jgi:hypothetical protein
MDSRPKHEQLLEFRERSAEEQKRIDAAAGMVASMGIEELTEKLADASIATTGSRPEREERMLAYVLGEDVNYVNGAGSSGDDRAGAGEGPGELLSPRSLAVMRSLTRSSPPLLDSWEPTANVSEVACTEYFETAKALARPAVLDSARYPAVAGAGCTWGWRRAHGRRWDAHERW